MIENNHIIWAKTHKLNVMDSFGDFNISVCQKSEMIIILMSIFRYENYKKNIISNAWLLISICWWLTTDHCMKMDNVFNLSDQTEMGNDNKIIKISK